MSWRHKELYVKYPDAHCCIVSVWHTGTRRLVEYLRHFDPLPAYHVQTPWMHVLREYSELGVPLVAPMRHPQETWDSWVNRDEIEPEKFREQWLNLMSLKIDFWLPLDLANRQEYRNILQQHLGLNHDDWDKVGHVKLKEDFKAVPIPHVEGLREFAESFGYHWKDEKTF